MRSPLNFFPRNIFLTNRDMLEVKVQPTKITNIMTKKTFTTETETIITEKTTTTTTPEEKNLKDIAPKKVGRLDMVIAFDTTGSMAAYIEDVRQQVADLIPRLFKDNDDLRLGIVAFGPPTTRTTSSSSSANRKTPAVATATSSTSLSSRR